MQRKAINLRRRGAFLSLVFLLRGNGHKGTDGDDPFHKYFIFNSDVG